MNSMHSIGYTYREIIFLLYLPVQLFRQQHITTIANYEFRARISAWKYQYYTINKEWYSANRHLSDCHALW